LFLWCVYLFRVIQCIPGTENSDLPELTARIEKWIEKGVVKQLPLFRGFGKGVGSGKKKKKRSKNDIDEAESADDSEDKCCSSPSRDGNY
jgi:hypothetical protein